MILHFNDASAKRGCGGFNGRRKAEENENFELRTATRCV